MSSANRINGVIFDLDGVIVDTEHLWEASWTAYCAARGGEWTLEDTTTVQGMSAPEWARYIAERLGAPERAEDVRRACVEHVIGAMSAGHGPLLDGAHDLVVALSKRVPVALASSAPRRVIDTVLAHHGLTDRFSATVSSEEVARGKPSPDVYGEAARRIGVAGGAGVAIEDSSNGIRAAHAAGLLVVAIPNRTYPPEPDAVRLADHVATDYTDAGRYIVARLA